MSCFSKSSIVTCCPLSRMRASRSDGRLPSRFMPSRYMLHLCSLVGPKVSRRCFLNNDQFSAVGSPNINEFMVGPMLAPMVLSKKANFCLGSVTSSRAYAASIRCIHIWMFCLSKAGRSGRFRFAAVVFRGAGALLASVRACNAAVAASRAAVMRSCCVRMIRDSSWAASAIRRISSGDASAGMFGMLIPSFASAKVSSQSSSVVVGKKEGPVKRAGEGDREPRPRPRGWLASWATERCVRSRDARVSRPDME